MKDKRAKEIYRNVMRRCLNSEWGRIADAFQKMRLLPKKIDGEIPNRFQRGLERIIGLTVRKTFDAFRNDFDEGQAMKKRATLIMLFKAQSGQKKMYNRWANLTKEEYLTRKCKSVG